MLLSLTKPGSFYDPETKLRLEYGEVKDVLSIGSLTRQVLNGGGIKMVSSPVTPKPIIEPIDEPPVDLVVASEPSTLDIILDTSEDIPVEKPKPTIANNNKKPGKRGRPKKVSK